AVEVHRVVREVGIALRRPGRSGRAGRPASRCGRVQADGHDATEVVGPHAIRRERAGENRDLVDRALEGIEVLTEPTDERWPATADEWSCGRARRREPTGNVAAVSPLIAPGCLKLTPGSTAPVRLLPLASSALLLPAASPRRQKPNGRSVNTCWVGPPTSIAPSAQLVTWPLDTQLPWLEVAEPGVSPAGMAT